MTVKRALLAAILVTGIVFIFISAPLSSTLGLIAAAFGVIWLVQEIYEREPLNSICFLVFAALGVLGALGDVSLPLLLLGLSADIAAWDLSRFRRRIHEEEASDEKARLERVHLQKLGIVLAAGLLIALVPALLTISVNFVVLLALMLIALIMLRQALLALRDDRKGRAR